MKIFITGGTGFIGSHTIVELSRRGHKLLLLSRKKVICPKNCVLLQGDLSCINRFQERIKKFKPDAFLHLAWEGLPDIGPEISLKNFLYGIDVIRLAQMVGVKKIIMSGSMFEYGAIKGAIKEDYGMRATIPVAAAKTALHYIGRAMAEKSGIDFIWAIFFSVYGPGQKSHSLIPYVISRMQLNLPPNIKTPEASQDFVYVTDVARVLALILEKHKQDQNNTYNIGSGRLSAVKDVVNQIYGKSIVKTRVVPGAVADISRIKREIGWVPEVGINEGIKRTLAAWHLHKKAAS